MDQFSDRCAEYFPKALLKADQAAAVMCVLYLRGNDLSVYSKQHQNEQVARQLLGFRNTEAFLNEFRETAFWVQHGDDVQKRVGELGSWNIEHIFSNIG